MVKRKRGMSCYVCDNCNSEYFRFSSQVRGLTKTCSKVCSTELIRKTGKLNGKNNPNYRHGKHSETNYCDCGAIKDHRSIRCAKCSNKGVPIQKEYRKTDQEVIDLVPLFNSYIEIAEEIGTSRSRVSKIVKDYDLDISF